MSALSLWSSLLLFGYAVPSSATVPPPASPPIIAEGRNATFAAQPPCAPGPVVMIRRHPVCEARERPVPRHTRPGRGRR